MRPPLDPALAGVRAAEEAGFDTVWWSDHFLHWFPPGVWTPDLTPMAATVRSPHAFLDPMPVIGAAAVQTSRIRLGTAVTDAVRRHPALLAQTFLTLDHLSHGRAVLGIGVGEAENILPFGFSYERRASRLIEAVEMIRLLWSTTDPVDLDGEFWTLDQAILGAEPYGDRPPEIWMASHRPRVLAATGRLADGWLPILIDPGEYAALLADLRAASVAAGRAADAVTAGLFAWIVVDEDRDAAEADARQPAAAAGGPDGAGRGVRPRRGGAADRGGLGAAALRPHAAHARAGARRWPPPCPTRCCGATSCGARPTTSSSACAPSGRRAWSTSTWPT